MLFQIQTAVPYRRTPMTSPCTRCIDVDRRVVNGSIVSASTRTMIALLDFLLGLLKWSHLA